MSFIDYGLIAVGVTAVLSWATWITTKVFGAMSEADHDIICEKKTESIRALIKEQGARMDRLVERIFEKMDAEREDASEKRHDLHDKLNVVAVQVAAIKAVMERDEKWIRPPQDRKR